MESKLCIKCNEVKPLADFYKRSTNSGGLQSCCRECSAKMAREYRQSMRDYVGEYKIKTGCEECGFKAKHPCQLDLDHTNPADKAYKGSHKAYDAGWSKERIDNELSKCRVLCKNCHSLRTFEEGHWKNEYTDISMRQSSAQ